jgi:hypothetical protein
MDLVMDTRTKAVAHFRAKFEYHIPCRKDGEIVLMWREWVTEPQSFYFYERNTAISAVRAYDPEGADLLLHYHTAEVRLLTYIESRQR